MYYDPFVLLLLSARVPCGQAFAACTGLRAGVRWGDRQYQGHCMGQLGSVLGLCKQADEHTVLG